MVHETERAKDYALHLLGFRSYSCAELQRRLLRKGFATETITRVIDILADFKYLDDEAYARRWVETLTRRRGYGTGRLRQELLNRSIERNLVEAILSEIPVEAEYERAKSLAEKKASSLGRKGIGRTYRRLAQFLTRQGFSPELSRRVLEEIMPRLE